MTKILYSGRHVMKILIAAIAVLLSTVAPVTVLAANPLQQSCGFVRALTEGGAEDAVAYLRDTMVSHWPEADREKMYDGYKPILQRYQFVGGNVYLIAMLADDVREHLLAIRVENGAMLYFRAVYSYFTGPGLALANLSVSDKFEEVSSPAFVQSPTLMTCN